MQNPVHERYDLVFARSLLFAAGRDPRQRRVCQKLGDDMGFEFPDKPHAAAAI
jgi:hypothetical protein